MRIVMDDAGDVPIDMAKALNIQILPVNASRRLFIPSALRPEKT